MPPPPFEDRWHATFTFLIRTFKWHPTHFLKNNGGGAFTFLKIGGTPPFLRDYILVYYNIILLIFMYWDIMYAYYNHRSAVLISKVRMMFLFELLVIAKYRN